MSILGRNCSYYSSTVSTWYVEHIRCLSFVFTLCTVVSPCLKENWLCIFMEIIWFHQTYSQIKWAIAVISEHPVQNNSMWICLFNLLWLIRNSLMQNWDLVLWIPETVFFNAGIFSDLPAAYNITVDVPANLKQAVVQPITFSSNIWISYICQIYSLKILCQLLHCWGYNSFLINLYKDLVNYAALNQPIWYYF